MVRTITKQFIVFKLLIMLLLLCITNFSVYAQEQEHSEHDLAKKAANPMLTANNNAPEGEQWLVPVGLGGGKNKSIG